MSSAPAIGGERTRLYDPIERSIGPRAIIRDQEGQRMGSVTTSPTGRVTLRDAEGNRIGTIERSGVIRDPDGNRIGHTRRR